MTMEDSKISVKWTREFDDTDLNRNKNLGGFGGWFDDGHRWKDFLEKYKKEVHPQLEAIRKSIIKNNIWQEGGWHQKSGEGVPLTSDGYYYDGSFRAWGDLMAAVWSTHYDKDYNYMHFYYIYTPEQPPEEE